jgi:hypothetical protein
MATVIRLAYSDVNSAGDTVLTIPASQPIGTYLAVLGSSSGGGSTLGLSDSKGNTWTQRQYASNSTSPSAVAAWWTTADTGLTVALTTSDTITLTSTAGSGAGDLMLVKIVPDPGGTVAYHNGAAGTGSGATAAVSSFSPAATDVVLNGVCVNSTTLNSNSTPGAGFTKLAGTDAHLQNRSCVGQYGVPGGATTTPMTIPTNPWASVSIALTQTAPTPGEFVGECARFIYESTSTKTVNIPVTNAVAAGQSIVMGLNVPSATANTGMTVTDSKGNTWTTVTDVGVSGPANAQQFIVYCTGLTTGLTTSDQITCTVTSGTGGTASARWLAVGIAYEGILGFDVSASNSGSSQNPDSGTTATADQNRQLVFVAFGGTGTGVTMTSIPSGFVATPPAATTSTVRNLWIVSGFVNASGTRHVTAHMSDNTSHAWAGTIAAFDSNASDPYAEYLLIPDVENGDGTGWAPAVFEMMNGAGWSA